MKPHFFLFFAGCHATFIWNTSLLLKNMFPLCYLFRSAMLVQVGKIKHSWFSTVAATGRCRAEVKDQFDQWILYQCGLNRLWKLLKDVELLLLPAGPAMCTLPQMQICMDEVSMWFFLLLVRVIFQVINYPLIPFNPERPRIIT